MKKNSLTPNKGLSLSQAASISNLCNQAALEIESVLEGINNYSKAVDINGEKLTILTGKKLPTDAIQLLKTKASLHACQAFLMENINAKDRMLKEAKTALVDITSVEIPKAPTYVNALAKNIPNVDENWGWEQLTASEINEFLEAEAYASHIGQFIHKGNPLDRLRRELRNGINPIEWMTIKDGERTPVTVDVHHTSDELMSVHESLAQLHRDYEQRVNYYKAKVKNLVTAKNAEIAKANADAQNDAEKQNNDIRAKYVAELEEYNGKIRTLQAEFEKERQAKIKEIASMRIAVDSRFQPIVDKFLKSLPETQEE